MRRGNLRFAVLAAFVVSVVACSGGGNSTPNTHPTNGPTPTPHPTGATPTPSPAPTGATPTPAPPHSLPFATYILGSTGPSATQGEIDIFAAGSVGSATPTRLTSKDLVTGGGVLTVDSNGMVYATGACDTTECKYSIVEYAASDIGLGVTPTIVINYPATSPPSPLYDPSALAVDSTFHLYVAQPTIAGQPGAIYILNPGASGSIAGEYQIIQGSNTTLSSGNPTGMALDAAGNIYVSVVPNTAGVLPWIAVFAPGRFGNVAPIRMIQGTNTVFASPAQLGVSANGTVYLMDSMYNEVFVFAPNANGNVLPMATFQSPDMPYPSPLTVDANGNVYVFDELIGAPPPLNVFGPSSNGVVDPLFQVAIPAALNQPAGVAVKP